MRELGKTNINGELITVEQACLLTNLGRDTVKNIAQKSNSVRKIGKSYRINRGIFLTFIEQQYAVTDQEVFE